LVMVGNSLAANLHAGVRAAPDELELELQLEVAVVALGAEELVPLDRRCERAGDDGAIFDAEDVEVPFPTGERFAIEERLRLGRFRGDGGQRSHRENRGGKQGEESSHGAAPRGKADQVSGSRIAAQTGGAKQTRASIADPQQEQVAQAASLC